MAVYEQGYQPWNGTLTSPSRRFLVIARFALKDVFNSKYFSRFYILSFIWPVMCICTIYIWNNLDFLTNLQKLKLIITDIDTRFFFAYVIVQGFLGFIITLIVGPTLISKELVNNAIPLYLSRPISRFDYIFGKLMVLIILLSAITWIPGINTWCRSLVLQPCQLRTGRDRRECRFN